jgi:hypothetical protein
MTVDITYFLADDSGSGLTGEPVSPDFNVTAANAAAALVIAQALAQNFATLFQRNVRLVDKYGSGSVAGPPWTPLYSANTTVMTLANATTAVNSP